LALKPWSAPRFAYSYSTLLNVDGFTRPASGPSIKGVHVGMVIGPRPKFKIYFFQEYNVLFVVFFHLLPRFTLSVHAIFPELESSGFNLASKTEPCAHVIEFV